jgi:DNA-binding transcriptional MerR regulator
MQAPEEAYSIGGLAELSGVPIKTIRYYSDVGILPPSGRTESRHRRYTGADLARLQLVRSLRELGVDLETIGGLLDRRADLGEVLAAHAATLESRIRALRRQLAVVRAAAASPSAATVRRVHALARLEAADRRRLLERFWDRATHGLPMDPRTAARFRSAGTPELPEDPTPGQLDAWLELAELAADEDFAAATRANAAWFWELAGERYDPVAWQALNQRTMDLARAAIRDGAAPDGPRGAAAAGVLAAAYARMVGRADGPAFRAWLLGQFAAHADPRAERYWELVAADRGEQPDRGAADAFNWLLAALQTTAWPGHLPAHDPLRGRRNVHPPAYGPRDQGMDE